MFTYSVLSTVLVHPTRGSSSFNLYTPSVFMSLVLIWSLILNYITPFISCWHSLVVTGLFIISDYVTVQFVIAAVFILLLSCQVWYWKGESQYSLNQHGSLRKGTIGACILCKSAIILIHADTVSYTQLLDELKVVIDWWSFGKALGIPKAKLLTIYRDGKFTENCRRLLLETWSKLERPTWSTVISSLFKCGMTTLGWKIAIKHST